ncbi:MAG: hypothetical protein ABS46_13475 [Cytophagaceae bacterium SCN 52-12]|nr:MAG: hypothetical protein ABS46_13475 [Cytophagaceae bacterium SCN 52-12]
MQSTRNRPTIFFQLGLLSAYASLLALSLYRHECWRDELQAWNIVTSSSGIGELFRNKEYEGHPSLWFLVLYPVSRLTHSPVSIQVVNWLIAVGAAGLLIYRSPFTLIEKTLILFGYFFVFEYGTISRNYMIGVLILLAIGALWKSYRRRWIVVCILLWLLMQTNAYMACIALAVSTVLLYRHWSSGTLINSATIFGIMIVLSGLIFFVVTTNPPPDSSYASGWNFSFDFRGLRLILSNLYKGLVTIPELNRTFWGSNVVRSSEAAALLGFFTLLIAIYCLLRSPYALAFLLLSFLLLSVFMNMKFAGHLRHHGHFSIALLFALWIAGYEKSYTRGPVILLLLIQFFAGLFACYTDIRHPFSYSKYVAAYIRNNYPHDIPLIAAYNDMATPVAGYLQRKMYFLNDGRYASYVIWSRDYWNRQNYRFEQKELFRRMDRYIAGRNDKYLLVMNYRSADDEQKEALEPGTSKDFTIEDRTYRIHSAGRFSGAIVPDENYYLYEVTPVAD